LSSFSYHSMKFSPGIETKIYLLAKKALCSMREG
jgi:hypothetical protein